MEERSVESMDNSHLLLRVARVGFASVDLLLHIQALVAVGSLGSHDIYLVSAILLNIVAAWHGFAEASFLQLCRRRRRSRTANFGDAEDGFPAAKFGCRLGRVAEASRDESTFGPAVVDARQMPLD